MRTVDRLVIHAAPERVWPLAAEVEAWPEILAHYRWVRRLAGAHAGDGVVEMAAWRPFGRLRWPTWWRSEMRVDPAAQEIRYRHVAGITRGMDVLWALRPIEKAATEVTIVHEWTGPGWPLIGTFAAEQVIGPIFVHGIASRTLAGIGRAAEAGS